MEDPSRYETFKLVAKVDTKEILPGLIERMSFKPNELILDYGCGAGSVTLEYFVPIAELNGSRIDGIDQSMAMLSYAKAYNSHPLINYYVGDILTSDFPLEGKRYDRIFSMYVLHYVSDYTTMINRFFDILKPGGELAITAVEQNPLYDIMELLRQNPKWSPLMTGCNTWSPSWDGCVQGTAEKMIGEALVHAGFVVTELKTTRRIHPNFSREAINEFFWSMNPFVKQIPKDLLSEYKVSFWEAADQCFGVDAQGKTPCVKYYTVVALASKP